MRAIALRLHRYVGLTLAAFLVLLGLTGSVLAFQAELDAWLNPELYTHTSTGTLLGPSELVDRVEAQLPEATITYLTLPSSADGAADGSKSPVAHLRAAPRATAASPVPTTLDFDQVFADPVTGRVLGTRKWGEISLERKALVPFVYKLHYTLHTPDARFGAVLLGIVSLVWVFDCFVGLYLTWPARRLRVDRRTLGRWAKAFKIERRAGAARLTFDLHRAAGLWLWLVLLLLAFSGVYFNLNAEVFRPVMSRLVSFTPTPFETRPAATPPETVESPRIGFDEAVALAAREGGRRGFAPPTGVAHSATYGVYSVYATPPRNRPSLGTRVVYVDDTDGAILGVRSPSTGTAGDLVSRLQFPIHSGQIGGLAGRLVICFAGLATALLSVTGVLLWLRRRLRRSRATTVSASASEERVRRAA